MYSSKCICKFFLKNIKLWLEIHYSRLSRLLWGLLIYLQYQALPFRHMVFFFPWIFLTQDWLIPWIGTCGCRRLTAYSILFTHLSVDGHILVFLKNWCTSTNLTGCFNYFGCVPRSVIIWSYNHYIYFYKQFWLVELQSLCRRNAYTSLSPNFHSVSPSIGMFFSCIKVGIKMLINHILFINLLSIYIFLDIGMYF